MDLLTGVEHCLMSSPRFRNTTTYKGSQNLFRLPRLLIINILSGLRQISTKYTKFRKTPMPIMHTLNLNIRIMPLLKNFLMDNSTLRLSQLTGYHNPMDLIRIILKVHNTMVFQTIPIQSETPMEHQCRFLRRDHSPNQVMGCRHKPLMAK